MPSDCRLSITVSEELRDRLRQHQRETGIPTAELVRRLLETHLNARDRIREKETKEDA